MARRTPVSIDGHRVDFTNLDKVLYPETGTTKADVLDYYSRVAPLLIEHAAWRPVTLRRWVNGVGTSESPQSGFFQKDIAATSPSWVKRFAIEHSDHTNEYPLVNDVATLAWLAQLAALEIHTPQWRFGPRGARRNPDRLVIDLDPGDGVDLPQCAAVARIVRERLRSEGLETVPVTSGSKGIHLYAALDGTRTSDAISEFAHELAREIEADHRDLVVSDMAKRLRSGKVLIDWSQNNGSKTTIAPYSLRGRVRPTVAVPRTWRELASPTLRHLEYSDVLDRIRRGRADPLAGLASEPRHLHLAPEPSERAFVIQEHHARRWHYDLRLQNSGVLVSWALPKGVPLDPGRDHLAIHTEDHPLEYGTFETPMPAGEHGGGSVRIWDSGTFDLLTWREGEEVVATLHGRAGGGLGGPRTFALVHTGRAGEDDDHWLIHAMDEPSPRGGTIPVAPMLAAVAPAGEPSGDDWRFEMKWDGIRAIAQVRSGVARLWSRNGNDLTQTFPELARELPTALGVRDAIVDGEIIAPDAGGRPSFERLQRRLGVTPADDPADDHPTPVHLMLFDVLEKDGEQLVDLTYLQRRAILESLVRETGHTHVPPSYDTDLDSALAISSRHGLEGVVAKRPASPYRAGTRSPAWLKVKHERFQEVVLVGWIEGAGGGVGSLAVAVPSKDGELRYAGRVGTGFTDRERAALHAALVPLARTAAPVAGAPRRPPIHWVEPALVGEVRFAEWTRAGRLRHPTWRGLRSDKTASQVTTPDS